MLIEKVYRECDSELVVPRDRNGADNLNRLPRPLTGCLSGNEAAPESSHLRPKEHMEYYLIPGGVSARCLYFIPRTDLRSSLLVVPKMNTWNLSEKHWT